MRFIYVLCSGFLLTGYLLLTVLLSYRIQNSFEKLLKSKPTVFNMEPKSTRKRPVILLWTTLHFKYSYWYEWIFKEHHSCSSWTCHLTTDRRYINISDVVVFSLVDIRLNDLPRYRTENQIWLAYTREPPYILKKSNPYTNFKKFRYV